ncbi:TIM barrel protein [Streptomyces sp. NPDC048419]|uniref:TIM barrel protein n=1 Tax=Streptomyces sp. NPDC048419 TaxID=3365547 RepID=UPI0037100571
MSIEKRIAGAPISWGVCEVPGWGHLMSPDRVFTEMRQVGLAATEAGPDDFLPWGREDVGEFLAGQGLGLVGGFVPTVLHRNPAIALAAVRLAAQRFTEAGGDVVVLAAATGEVGYDGRPELSTADWAVLCKTLDAAVEVGAEYGASVVLHPHMGTVVESGDEVWRVLDSTEISLCVDTGHLLIGGVDPYELVQQAASRVGHVHFKDVDASIAARVQAGELSYTAAITKGLYCPLGDGDVDVSGIVAVLEGHGYGGWYVLEQDLVLTSEPPSGDGPVLDVTASRDFLISSYSQGR